MKTKEDVKVAIAAMRYMMRAEIVRQLNESANLMRTLYLRVDDESLPEYQRNLASGQYHLEREIYDHAQRVLEGMNANERLLANLARRDNQLELFGADEI